MTDKKPIVIIIGPQGSGKGTQGKRLAEKLSVSYLETGQLLRDEIASGSERGVFFGSIMDSGGHLADSDVGSFMREKMQAVYRSEGGFIIDGFPRSIGQAEVLESVVVPTHVLLIDISDSESIRRLSARRRCPKDGTIYNLITAPPQEDELCDKCKTKLEQRVDDAPQAIQKRLDWYHTDTEPLIARYEKKGILHRVDGMPSIDDVEKDVASIFKEYIL